MAARHTAELATAHAEMATAKGRVQELLQERVAQETEFREAQRQALAATQESAELRLRLEASQEEVRSLRGLAIAPERLVESEASRDAYRR